MTGQRIDVHAHVPIGASASLPPGKSPGGIRATRPKTAPNFDAAAALDHLDRHEIQTQLLSMPHLFSSPPQRDGQAARSARQVNETFAALVADHPRRFGAYATVPIDTSDDAIEELAYALDVLRLDGVALTSNSQGRYLGDPVFEPVLAEADRRAVPVFVHPTNPVHADELTLGRPSWLVEFPFDTARSITDAIYAGVFDRHPGLRVVVAHCGGALPSLAWRITHLADIGRGTHDTDITAQRVTRALGKLYYETALSGASSTIRTILQLTDHSHILYGTDTGAATDQTVTRNSEGLQAYDFTAEQLAGINHDNAARLFRRLRSEPTDETSP